MGILDEEGPGSGKQDHSRQKRVMDWQEKTLLVKKMAMIFQRAEFLWKNSPSRQKRVMDWQEKTRLVKRWP